LIKGHNGGRLHSYSKRQQSFDHVDHLEALEMSVSNMIHWALFMLAAAFIISDTPSLIYHTPDSLILPLD